MSANYTAAGRVEQRKTRHQQEKPQETRTRNQKGKTQGKPGAPPAKHGTTEPEKAENHRKTTKKTNRKENHRNQNQEKELESQRIKFASRERMKVEESRLHDKGPHPGKPPKTTPHRQQSQ
jgi:hypothetical protein